MSHINVEVVFAMPLQQRLVSLSVEPDTTIADVVKRSGFAAEFPDFDFDTASIGIWGRVVDRGRAVKDGDRVEIYRGLAMDPREARRQMALSGQTMSGATSEKN